jgi:hypothetical protein
MDGWGCAIVHAAWRKELVQCHKLGHQQSFLFREWRSGLLMRLFRPGNIACMAIARQTRRCATSLVPFASVLVPVHVLQQVLGESGA